MKDFKKKKNQKKKPRDNYGFRTSKSFRQQTLREQKTMGARPRALGGHQ